MSECPRSTAPPSGLAVWGPRSSSSRARGPRAGGAPLRRRQAARSPSGRRSDEFRPPGQSLTSKTRPPGDENLPADTRNPRSRQLALYVLCVGVLMIVLDATIVNVALPSIQQDLGFSQS